MILRNVRAFDRFEGRTLLEVYNKLMLRVFFKVLGLASCISLHQTLFLGKVLLNLIR